MFWTLKADSGLYERTDTGIVYMALLESGTKQLSCESSGNLSKSELHNSHTQLKIQRS